jgi:hypothetical protein
LRRYGNTVDSKVHIFTYMHAYICAPEPHLGNISNNNF